MKELKADAYLERLDQLQRKYTSIDYRLSLLIEQETTPPAPPCMNCSLASKRLNSSV